MYEIENNSLIRYNVEKFILLTTTKNFFQQDNSYKQKLQNYSLFINLIGKFLSQEKCFHLLEFLSKLSYLVDDKTLLFCEQIHGNNVVTVNNIDILRFTNTFKLDNIIVKYLFFQKTDGIISLLPTTAVIIFTADCVPLFVYDTFGEVFGLVHVGRKGIENGVIESLVVKLGEISNDKLRFKFIIGPHICPNCYFVDGKPYSLVDKIIAIIKRYSFAVENITISQLCTYHMDDLFVSYRRDRTSYRLLSFITPVVFR